MIFFSISLPSAGVFSISSWCTLKVEEALDDTD
jgi:hypothetical protein